MYDVRHSIEIHLLIFENYVFSLEPTIFRKESFFDGPYKNACYI